MSTVAENGWPVGEVVAETGDWVVTRIGFEVPCCSDLTVQSGDAGFFLERAGGPGSEGSARNMVGITLKGDVGTIVDLAGVDGLASAGDLAFFARSGPAAGQCTVSAVDYQGQPVGEPFAVLTSQAEADQCRVDAAELGDRIVVWAPNSSGPPRSPTRITAVDGQTATVIEEFELPVGALYSSETDDGVWLYGYATDPMGSESAFVWLSVDGDVTTTPTDISQTAVYAQFGGMLVRSDPLLLVTPPGAELVRTPIPELVDPLLSTEETRFLLGGLIAVTNDLIWYVSWLPGQEFAVTAFDLGTGSSRGWIDLPVECQFPQVVDASDESMTLYCSSTTNVGSLLTVKQPSGGE